MLLDLACLALSATLGAVQPAYVPIVARAQMDSTPLLTTDALSRMTTFWQTFVKEPDSIRTTGRKANQEPLTISVGQRQMKLPGVVNMTAMATKYPSVAADFKTAGLTPQQWDGYREALFGVTVAQATGVASGLPASSALGQNIAFLQTHQTELNALQATGMWFPQVQQSQAGGGGGDLQP
jgi:hypothetical protein